MTNREKYIDKASNEELSKLLASKCFITATDKITYNVFGKGKENNSIDKWLSQEAEEDNKEKMQEITVLEMPKDDSTRKAIEYILLQLTLLSARLDKLEKCNRIAEVKEHIKERLEEKTKDVFKNMQPVTKEDAEKLVNKIGLCAKEVKQMNKTADEMFEELGYKKVFSDALCEYIKELIGGETIYFRGSAYNAKRIIINDNLEYWSNIAITKAEDKAIHKKIEELEGKEKNATNM